MAAVKKLQNASDSHCAF